MVVIRSELVESGGGPVIVRSAVGDDAKRLRRMAQRLERASHPGVVQVLGSSGTNERWELRMAYGGRPIALARALAPQQVAGAAAAVAATLADLHAGGIVHGRVTASRVLVGPHGRPVLCGLGDDVDGRRPEDDVASVGRLIIELLGHSTDTEPVPERRWRDRRPHPVRRSLLLLADHACAEPPSRRPTARALAASLAEAVPSAPRGVGEAGHRHHEPSARGTGAPARSSVGWMAGVVGLVVVVVVVSGALRVAPQDELDRSRPAVDGSAEPAGRGPAASSAPSAAHVEGPAVPCPRPCGPVSVRDTIVRVGGTRFDVGQPGDRVVVGDWACRGAPVPTVLRPSTGEVFVFPGWAGENAVTVTATTTVAGARDLVVEHDERGCPVVAIVRSDGARTPVHAASRS